MNDVIAKIKHMPWKTWVALIFVYASLFYQWYWVWGVVFIMWTIQSIKSNETYLVETITKDEHPVVFGIIVLTWMVVSAFMIIIDIWALL